MSAAAFLLDENVPEFLANELIRLEPSIEVFQVGQDLAPSKGTHDADLLVFAEDNMMTFVTMDKQTMAVHLANHFTLGRHTWGVVLLKQGHPTFKYAEDLILLWSASELKDLMDWSGYLPY